MIIANLLGSTKMALMTQAEVYAWEASTPADQDLIYNTETKSFWHYDGTSGAAVDEGTAVTTWKIDDTAPASGSYYWAPQTIGRVILLFALDGVMFRVRTSPALAANEIYHNRETGFFELYIAVTPAVEFSGQWLTLIYNNDSPPV